VEGYQAAGGGGAEEERGEASAEVVESLWRSKGRKGRWRRRPREGTQGWMDRVVVGPTRGRRRKKWK
jgi:hypothetical protein